MTYFVCGFVAYFVWHEISRVASVVLILGIIALGFVVHLP
jgi:hypothetical protein